MPWVQRENGNIVGVFQNEQPGLAEEFMSDSNPEFTAFNNRKSPIKTVDLIVDDKVDKDPTLKGIVDYLSTKFGDSKGQIVAAIKQGAKR